MIGRRIGGSGKKHRQLRRKSTRAYTARTSGTVSRLPSTSQPSNLHQQTLQNDCSLTFGRRRTTSSTKIKYLLVNNDIDVLVDFFCLLLLFARCSTVRIKPQRRNDAILDFTDANTDEVVDFLKVGFNFVLSIGLGIKRDLPRATVRLRYTHQLLSRFAFLVENNDKQTSKKYNLMRQAINWHASVKFRVLFIRKASEVVPLYVPPIRKAS